MSGRAGIEAALGAADIRCGGGRQWDPVITDERVWRAVARRGVSGLCDAWVEGWWTCPAPDELFARALKAGLADRLRWTWPNVLARVRDSAINRQTMGRSRAHVRRHYDLGNDLFEGMLDRRMNYSCAWWDGAADLDEAQERKLELICRKLGLRAGMRLLDIGCGWGGLVGYAAERYGCACVGITLSEAQARYASERYRGLGVEIRLQDYRLVPDRFDRVASVGMFEHVGPRNYGRFMGAVSRALAPGGLALLHFFGTEYGWPTLRRPECVWVERHIFPGMAAPSLGQVGRALEGRFVVEDLHNFGADYDPTLMAWHERFMRSWPGLSGRYGERFGRMWRIYLLVCAAAFRARRYQLWQFVLSARGVPGGYRRPALAGSAVEARPARAPDGAGDATIDGLSTVAGDVIERVV